MFHENVVIKIAGEEIGDLYCELISLDVELDDELASMVRLLIPLEKQPDGSWPALDDERLMPWQELTIGLGFVEDTIEPLMSGYITHVKTHFDPDLAECTLELWGMDGSVLMDRVEKLKAWPNKKDSDIAREILNQYGFTPEVTDTTVIHDEAVSTIIQRETDMQFLRRLALRNGFECYVEGDTAYFRPPQVDDEPQPGLAAHFGGQTNLNHFAVELNALTPANVDMSQVDRGNKELLQAAVESSQLKSLGNTDATGLLATGVDPAQVHMAMNVATGIPEMTALCQGLYEQGAWFVTGEGEISGNAYGHVLRPRRTVTIKGVGEPYSGVYYVTHVTHSITRDGYTQSFRVKRNAIMPTGMENFSKADEPL